MSGPAAESAPGAAFIFRWRRSAGMIGLRGGQKLRKSGQTGGLGAILADFCAWRPPARARSISNLESRDGRQMNLGHPDMYRTDDLDRPHHRIDATLIFSFLDGCDGDEGGSSSKGEPRAPFAQQGCCSAPLSTGLSPRELVCPTYVPSLPVKCQQGWCSSAAAILLLVLNFHLAVVAADGCVQSQFHRWPSAVLHCICRSSAKVV